MCGNTVQTYPMNVYWGGACLVRPMMRMSQMAASVESRGINLMHSLFFLKATSSKEITTERCESDGDTASSPVWAAEGMATLVIWKKPLRTGDGSRVHQSACPASRA